MTETNAITTLNSGDTYLGKPGSCGRPVLNVQIRIADDALNELPVGEAGEVLIRGPTLMKGSTHHMYMCVCVLLSTCVCTCVCD